jgi:hypothetical protein
MSGVAAVSLAAPIESEVALEAWDAANGRAGSHPAALELPAERRIAVLGSDGNNDTSPSAAALTAMANAVRVGDHILERLG